MTENAHSEFRDFIADVLYQNLVSADKSTEIGIEFLKMNIKKRRLTYNQIRKITYFYADRLIESLESLGKEPNKKEKSDMIQDALYTAWKKYTEEADG